MGLIPCASPCSPECRRDALTPLRCPVAGSAKRADSVFSANPASCSTMKHMKAMKHGQISTAPRKQTVGGRARRPCRAAAHPEDSPCPKSKKPKDVGMISCPWAFLFRCQLFSFSAFQLFLSIPCTDGHRSRQPTERSAFLGFLCFLWPITLRPLAPASGHASERRTRTVDVAPPRGSLHRFPSRPARRRAPDSTPLFTPPWSCSTRVPDASRSTAPDRFHAQSILPLTHDSLPLHARRFAGHAFPPSRRLP